MSSMTIPTNIIDVISDLLLAIFVWYLYRPTLHGPFVFDDMAILNNLSDRSDPMKPPLDPILTLLSNTFTQLKAVIRTRSLQPLYNFWHYRPLTWLTYHYDLQLGYLDPYVWHRTNVILHIGSVIVAHRLSLYLLTPTGALVAATLFACHPLATSAVAYIAARSTMLCSFFILVSLLSALNGQWSLTALFSLIAFWSKPEALVLPVLLGGLWWLKLIP